MKPLALAFTLALGLHAADWRIPITGVVLDPVNQSLRPIQGLPGASLLGPPLGLPFAVRRAAILEKRNAAIVIQAGDAGQAWLVTGLLDGDLQTKFLEGTIAGVDRIATNAAGSVAALYSRSDSTLQFVSGLPGSPSVSEPISLAGVSGTVSAMAVSDDGAWALIGAADSGTGAVYRVGTNSEPALVTTAADPRAIVLMGQDALIADYGIDEVLLIKDVIGARERILFANGPGGVSGPVAIQVLDDKSVLIANAGSQTIGRVDPVTWQMTTIPVSAVPERLEKLSLANVYALNQPGGAPLLLLDGSAEMRVVFVPQER